MQPLLDFVAAATGTALVLGILLATGWAWRLALDHPNDRSLHVRPTPRVGGLALVPVALAWIGARGLLPLPLLLAPALLLAVCFVDDRRGLPIALRFGIQILAAAALVLWAVVALPCPPGGSALPGACAAWGDGAAHGPMAVLAAGLAVLAVVWMTNLYNFMDGSDGLAGGMALFGFGACALAALHAGQTQWAGACAALAGAAAGFLLFNFHPARVFLGDAGSIPLGFLAATLGLAGAATGVWPLWFAPLAFSPFIADATMTLLARARRGERVWRAHREHIYQRMVRAGWGHRRTALAWYGLMAAAGASALALLGASAAVRAAALGAWALAYPMAFYLARQRWKA